MPEVMLPRPAGSRRSKQCGAELIAAAGTAGAETMPDERVKRLAAAGSHAGLDVVTFRGARETDAFAALLRNAINWGMGA